MGRLTPQEIRENEFKQAALGYNKEQVHHFLETVASELETLIQESNEIQRENKELHLTLKTYMNVEESLKETLLLAQKTGRDTIRNAQKEADTIISRATMEKNALLFSAKEDLSSIQHKILEFQTRQKAMLIKLKNAFRSNLELLEEEFSKESDALQLENLDLPNERIVDFSKNDLVVNDLPEESDDTTIAIEDVENFEDK